MDSFASTQDTELSGVEWDSKVNVLNASLRTPASSAHHVVVDQDDDEEGLDKDGKIQTQKRYEGGAKKDRSGSSVVQPLASKKSDDVEVDWDSDISWPEINIPGTWGTEGLEEYPWEDSKRPYTQFRRYTDLELNEVEAKGVLTDRIIAACSSYLDRSPETGKYVLCKVDLSKKILQDIRIIRYHHYLQYVDLAWNELSDVTPLSQLPFLMYLDVSHNFLTKVLDFKPPFNLTYVNYSYNSISELQDLTKFWSIVYLDLSHNTICQITGLQELKYLRHLNLSHNSISCIENLNHMKLLTLHLQNNQIERFEEGDGIGLTTLIDLLRINLAHNRLRTLRLLEGVVGIQKINFAYNSLDDLMELNYLRGLNYLTEVDFRGNCIVSMKYYIQVCLSTMKYLYALDGESIDAASKVLVRDHFDPPPYLQAARNATKTLFIQQVNDPILGSSIIPFDQETPPIIVLVGPPGSNKNKITDHFLQQNQRSTVKGVSHTSREKNIEEINGNTYYFVDKHTFTKMASNGEFLTVSQFLGHSYGLAEAEINKVMGKSQVLVLHTNLTGALTLRLKGLRCLLVLSIASNVETHKRWLVEKYYNRYIGVMYMGAVEVENNPTKAKQFLKRCHMLLKSNTEEMTKDIIEQLVQKVTKAKKLDVEINENPDRISLHSRTSCKSCKSDTSEKTEKSDISISAAATRSSGELAKSKSKSASSGILKSPTTRSKSSTIDTQAARTSVTFNDGRFAQQNIPPHLRVHSSRSVTFDDASYSLSTSLQLSASKTVVHTGHDGVLLSVLSECTIDKEGAVAEIWDTHTHAIKHLIEDIINSREDYFEVHYSNPGLFYEVIFTDNLEESLKKLAKVLKQCISKQSRAPPHFEFRKDEVYQTMVATRLCALHKDIKNELSTTDKQIATLRQNTRSTLSKEELKKPKKEIIEHLKKKHHTAKSYKLPKETIVTLKLETESKSSSDNLSDHIQFE